MSRLSPVLLASVLVIGAVVPAPSTAQPASPWPQSRRAPSHQPGDIVDVFVPMSDGVQLHGTVYLPALAPGERAPTVLDLSPYFGVLGAKDTDDFDPHGPLASGRYEHLLVRGYAIALFSVRGSALSGGCLNFGGRLDQDDAFELVEWLGSRPWSNGRVGMTGYSYDGTTAWAAAVAAPPSLKTIVPVAGISDWYSYNFRRGVPLAHGPVFNAYYPSITEHVYLGSRAEDWALAQASRGCAERPGTYAHGFVTYADGDHDAWWDERDFRAQADRIEASVLLVHGLLENNVRTEHTLIYDDLTVSKAALLGQWDHGFPWMHPGLEDLRGAYEALTEAWFDAWLLPDGPEASSKAWVQDSTGLWHARSTWPGTPAAVRTLTLGPDGRLGGRVTGAGELGWFLTPPGFAPSPPGGIRVYTLPALVDERLPVEPPPHAQLAWLSEPLDGVALTGQARMDLTLSVDRPNAMVVAHLFDVAPDGTWTKVSHDYLDLAHRDSRDRGEPMPLLTPTPVEMQFLPVEHRFAAGHRIGVIVAGEAGQPMPHGSTRIKPALARQVVHAGALHLPRS